MQVYFVDNRKYIRVDGFIINFYIDYNDAKMIFNQIYPKYISSFRNMSRKEMLDGLEEYMKGDGGLIDALTTDDVDGSFIIYHLVKYVFLDFERLTTRKRILKREHTDEEWELKLIEYRHRCAYCGKAGIKLEKDHIVPVSKGGSDKISNIAPACRECNASKFNNDVHKWTGRTN